jgi:hypothetical protein
MVSMNIVAYYYKFHFGILEQVQLEAAKAFMYDFSIQLCITAVTRYYNGLIRPASKS